MGVLKKYSEGRTLEKAKDQATYISMKWNLDYESIWNIARCMSFGNTGGAFTAVNLIGDALEQGQTLDEIRRKYNVRKV